MNPQLPQVPTKLLIDGKWLEGTKESVSVTNPATNEELVKVSQGGIEETKQAINAAAKAFTDWLKRSPRERADLMNKIADLMEQESDRLAKIMSLEAGQPCKKAMGEMNPLGSKLRKDVV